MTPIFVARYLLWEFVFVEQHEAVIGYHMDSRVAPMMELANQAGEPLYLQVHVADQRFSAGVAELVELFVTKYGQERTKTCGWFRKGFDVVDIVTRSPKL